MSAAGSPPLDALTDEQRAILSLLLVQGRSYHEIAELLSIDAVRVRERAHAAIEALAPAELPAPDAAGRARIADYIVGEQSVSERTRTRAQLAGSESEQGWAETIARALAPLAKDALPAIPDLNPGPPPADRSRRRPRWPTAWLGLLALAAVAVILLTAGSGGSEAGKVGPAGRTIKRLILKPAGTDPQAVGAAAIVRQARGGLLLLLQGQGLPATPNDSYAVWLFNTPGDSRLLGFISPNVGADGTFSSGTPLPDDAVRFRELIVTLENTSRPVGPGQPVLETALRLS